MRSFRASAAWRRGAPFLALLGAAGLSAALSSGLVTAETVPAAEPSGSQTVVPPVPAASAGLSVPAGCAVTFGSAEPVSGEATGSERGSSRRVRLSGYVDIQCGGFRIQADTVVYDIVSKQGSAEGVVVLDWERNRITGSALEFDLERQTGKMSDASGWIEPESILEAKTIEKLDEDHVLLEKGVFTSCTQPIPYWSFRIGRGLFHLDHYAHLRHVRMNVGRVPIFYLPWMLWPIKGERATGLLFPQWGTSRKYGFFAGDAFFWPFARNADVTLYADYYRFGGLAGGLEANWLPSQRGGIHLNAYVLNDTRRDERRSMARLQVQQPVLGGWRLGADLNVVSDFRYYQDFERSLSDAARTVVLSSVTLIQNGEFTSVNVRAQRREQFFLVDPTLVGTAAASGGTSVLRSDLIQDTLPKVELRGRSRALPGSPLYFSFESSANYFRCNDQTHFPGAQPFCSDARWARLDIAPRLTIPLRPAPWFSFEGRAQLRETYYTAARDPVSGAIDDRARVDRNFYVLEGEFIGPRVFRVYASGSSFSPSYKHVFEPRLLYQYVPRIDAQERVPILDDRDPASGDLNLVNMSLRTSLFAKRPPRLGPPPGAPPAQGSPTGGALPWSSFPAPVETPPPPSPVPVSPEEPAQGAGEEAGETSEEPDGETPFSTDATGARSSTDATGPPSSPEREGAVPASPATSVPSGSAPSPLAEANPVEILNAEIGQSYSFQAPLSTRFRKERRCSDGTEPPCNGGGRPQEVLVADGTRGYGPLVFSLHFNPDVSVSLDLRSDYDLVNDRFTSNSFSGWYRWKAGYVSATYSRQSPASVIDADASQIRLGSGAVLFNRKLTLDADLGYDLRRSTSLDRRGRIGYYTQCCGFVIEYLQREFDVNRRREIRFVVDLKGIGKFLDPNVSLIK